ncbi:MAG: tryptophan synthase subunit alpha [Gammaproteobacteria bacterium]|nr:tryptophan synthase subunit alpha [Gammaproteobacteria bacterium]
MNRIDQVFGQARKQGHKLLIPFITAGDGGAAFTLQVMRALADEGADVIELGMPFSDPMADGPVVQKACERALAAGMNLRGVLELVRQFRNRNTHTPVVLMGYLNPVWRYGLQAFATDAAAAGVDALLIVDAPPEESADLHAVLQPLDLHQIMLAAPTSSDQRLQLISAAAGGFVYYVALKGVTGAASLDSQAMVEPLQRLRRYTKLPIAVGFGIKTAADATTVAEHADAVVIGSALVQVLAECQQQRSEPDRVIADFMAPLRAALDAPVSLTS